MFITCQMPFKSGWPSDARGARYAAWPCPTAVVELTTSVVVRAAAASAMVVPLNPLIMVTTPPNEARI